MTAKIVVFTIVLMLTMSVASVVSQERAARSATPVPVEIQAADFNPAESAGLFVGVREFRFGLAEIPYAVDDAVDLAHLFALELQLIVPTKVILALAGDPQKSESVARLRALEAAGAVRKEPSIGELNNLITTHGNATGPGGVYVVAFATHGFDDQGSQILAAADSVSANMRESGIRASTVFDFVARSIAPRRLVLLDACRERLDPNRAIGGSDPRSAMGTGFVEALSQASGQVILQATTPGGYSYDDPSIENGVFSAAVISGPGGAAEPDARGLITAESLANYVGTEVQAWVERYRAEHTKISQGISSKFEGPAATMPLAANAERLESVRSYLERRTVALSLLTQAMRRSGSQISGAVFDQINKVLPETPDDQAFDLLGHIEDLDGSGRRERSLLRFLREGEVQAGLSLTEWPRELVVAAETLTPFEIARLRDYLLLPEDIVSFSKSGSWERPREARFAIVSGCGGGGGGAPGVRLPRAVRLGQDANFKEGAEYGPAAGGRAAELTSFLVGPLDGAEYEIFVGEGGTGGVAREFRILSESTAGAATSFSGDDVPKRVFEGGRAGPIDRATARVENLAGESGEDGPEGSGGGKGGAVYQQGRDATSYCAGGGGAGSNRNSDNKAHGGTGGSGILVIYPLARRHF